MANAPGHADGERDSAGGEVGNGGADRRGGCGSGDGGQGGWLRGCSRHGARSARGRAVGFHFEDSYEKPGLAAIEAHCDGVRRAMAAAEECPLNTLAAAGAPSIARLGELGRRG
jgi:hypothetical protein